MYRGCPWATGRIQQADTNQTGNWSEVTCWHCQGYYRPDGGSQYWNNRDEESYKAVYGPVRDDWKLPQ